MPKYETTRDPRNFARAFCEEETCFWDSHGSPTTKEARAHTAATGHTTCYEQTRQIIYRAEKSDH